MSRISEVMRERRCSYTEAKRVAEQEAQGSFAAPIGSATPDALIIAFVQGAKWWEYHKTGATMWPTDRDLAEGEAEKRAAKGTLGKSPNRQIGETGRMPESGK